MVEYLGEEICDIKDTPFKDFKGKEWVLYFIEVYGGYDGGHHKDWVLDQVARLLHGSNVTIKLAKWDDGQSEYRVSVDKENPPKAYTDWVDTFLEEDDGETYLNYDCGIAP